MKKPIIFLLLALCLVLLAIYLFSPKEDKEVVHVSHTMIVQQIEELGKLEVVKYSISDVMEYTKKRDWLPNSKIALMIMGEVVGCVDLTLITEGDVSVSGDSIHLMLPSPEICTFKIDHSKSKVYDVKYGLWETHELIDEAYRDAEKQIRDQALTMGLADEGRANTRKVLVPLLQMMGFKRIGMTFQKASYEGIPTLSR